MRRTAVIAPSTAPCHTNWSSAHPIACATGCWIISRSITLIVVLLPDVAVAGRVRGGTAGSFRGAGGPAIVEQPADLTQFCRAGSPCGERLHHELRGRAAEGAVEQIANQLALGLGLGHPCLVDMGAVRRVAPDE